MCHEVPPDDLEVDAWTSVRENDFRRQFEHTVRAFTVVSIEQTCILYCAGELDGERYLELTFDDDYYGRASVIRAVAEEYGSPISMYVASAAVMHDSLFWCEKMIMNCSEPGFEQVDLQDRELGQYRFRRLEGYQRCDVTKSLLSDLEQILPVQRERLVVEFFPPPTHCSLRFMRMEELADLAASELVTIGGHSHCHYRLMRLDK